MLDWADYVITVYRHADEHRPLLPSDGRAYGGVRDTYDVLLIARDGSAHVYQSYR